jgi:hypothetical protein
MAKIAAMTEDERKEWYRVRREKIARVRSNRREEIKEWKRETVEKLGVLIKEDCLQLDDPSVQPSQVTLWKLHALLSQGFSIVEIRDTLLSSQVCTEIGWGKLKSALFNKSLAKIEDLGLDIFTSQQASRELIQREIRHLEKMKKAKPFDVNLSKTIIDAAERLHKIQLEMTKAFGAIGVVGDKKGKTTNHITLISNVPRPKPISEPLPIDVTPESAG